MSAGRKVEHDVYGGLQGMDRKRRLQVRSVGRIREEIVLIPRIRVEAFFDTDVIPEVLRNSAAHDGVALDLATQSSGNSLVVRISTVDVKFEEIVVFV